MDATRSKHGYTFQELTSRAATMRATQAEDDAHRLLQLVRAQTKKTKTHSNACTRNRTNETREASSPSRHRHQHLAPKSPQSRKLAKTKALMAVYGLRHTPAQPNQPKDDTKSEELSEEKRRELLKARRSVYHNHFSGLQATYGLTGRPKLDSLIDAAVEAKHTSSKHCAMAIGAAVLTSANRIYASCRLDNAHDGRFDVCAERAVLHKVVEHQSRTHTIEVVEAMVISSDQRGLLPVPCGSCREYLAEFGDFPIFLLNAEHDSQETRSFELFPMARHSTYTAMASTPCGTTATKVKAPLSTAPSNHRRPDDVRDWTSDHVAQWLQDTVELPQYTDVFGEKQMDGATLLHLADADLQLLLGIVHPLHRRRLLVHLDRLKDRALLTHGVLDFGQLQDYLAVLDRDRLEVVAQLKATFDRLDANRDGLLDFAQVKNALRGLGLDVGGSSSSSSSSPSSATAAEELLRTMAADGSVSFADFCRVFSQWAQLPVGEVHDANANAVPSVDLVALRTTFDRADVNHSGSVDEQELVELLRSLGRDQCEQRAREWFAHADTDGDGRLSFAEFFLRYAQLTGVDLDTISARFVGEGKPALAQRQSVKKLESALHQLFPNADAADVRAWCQRTPWTEATQTGIGSNKTLSFAEFALACVMYGNALRERVTRLKEMQQALHGDALCHHSRVVHLQQSGHVRLSRPGGGEEGEDPPKRGRWKREDKGGDQEDDERRDDEERRVRRTFLQFAKAPERSASKRRRGGEEADAKQQSSSSEEEEDERTRCVNASEAAQALLELGLACGRDTLLRFLDREGVGLRRSLDWRGFYRVYQRLRVLRSMPVGPKATRALEELWEVVTDSKRSRQRTRSKPEAKEEEGEKVGSHAKRRDYDAYLKERHRQRMKKDGSEVIVRGRRRSAELERARAKRYHNRHSDSDATSTASDTDSQSSGESAGGSSSDRDTDGQRQRQRRRRRRQRLVCFRGFEVGDRVVTKAEGPGTLVQLHRAYFVADVHFDNGRKARNVALSELRRLRRGEEAVLRSSERAKRAELAEGVAVRVAHKGTKTATRRGVVLRCRTDGTYDVVANECGEQELLARVPLAQLAVERRPVVYRKDQRVTLKRRHEYARGRVVLCRTNGSYDVRLVRGGEVVTRVAWELLAPDEGQDPDDDEEEEEEEKEEKEEERRGRRDKRKQEEDDEDDRARRSKKNEAYSEEDHATARFREGQRVEARFQGGAAFYRGRVTRVYRDGACDIAYDDGDAETRVPASRVRSVEKRADAYEDDGFESD